MRKIILYVLSLFVLIGSVLAAASLQVPNSVDFYAEPDQTVSKTFVIKNNGDVKLTKIVFSSNADPKYSINFEGVDTLEIDESATITINITVRDDEALESKKIGNILIDAYEIEQISIPLNEHIGGLKIIEVDAKIGERKKAFNDLKDGDSIRPDYTRPGEPVVFEIDIKNEFSKDSENKIEDIGIKVTIVGIDDGEDLEEESEDFDLDPKESHKRTFEFMIPVELEEDEYDVLIDVEGEDDHRISREVHWTLKLNVEKRSHDIKIHKASLSPTKIICGGTAVLSTEIYNFGRNKEDKVKLTIKSPELGINIEEFPIELDNDLFEEESKWSKSFSIPVSKIQAAGTYPIEMWLYYNEDVSDDYKKLELVVEGCPVEEPEEEEVIEEEEEEVEEEKEEQEEQITGTVITETEEKTDRWAYIVFGVNVLLLFAVIVLIVVTFRRKR